MKGLMVREPWIDLLLDGAKTWELRTTRTTIRGEIALIRQGSGCVEGVAQLVDSLLPLDAEGLAQSFPFHRVPQGEQAAVLSRGWIFPWLMIDARRLSEPVPYLHPSGAVTWVDLDVDVTQHVARAKALGTSRVDLTRAADAFASYSGPRQTAPTQASAELVRAGETHTASSARISAGLEAQLVALADELGVRVDPLGSVNTKLRRFLVPYPTGDRPVLVNRMPRFQVFIAPALDQRFATEISQLPGVQRFSNSQTGEYRMRHSGFRVFGEPRTDREPFGHGWLLEEQRATDQFGRLVEILRSR